MFLEPPPEARLPTLLPALEAGREAGFTDGRWMFAAGRCTLAAGLLLIAGLLLTTGLRFTLAAGLGFTAGL